MISVAFSSLVRLLLLGSVVIFTFVLVFLPFLSSLPLLTQVLHRLFPFARGLYEDKVANFWCATSVIFKWHFRVKRERMVQAALAATIMSFLPSCLRVYRRPSRLSFLYALSASSLGFYLFSFQVHEKSILLPLLPLVLLQGRHSLLAAWMGAIATFSCYTLLQKDGHAVGYWVLQVLWTAASMSWARGEIMRPQAAQSPESSGASNSSWVSRVVRKANQHPLLLYRIVQLSLVGVLAVHVAAATLPAIPRYPDLASMLFVVYAAPHFLLFLGLVVLQQFALPIEAQEDLEFNAVGDAGQEQRKSKEQ